MTGSAEFRIKRPIEYMRAKKAKLKIQEAELQRQTPDEFPPIFRGLTIHVNGYTNPSHAELRRLIVQRDGDFQHYLSKSKVTNIVASNLTYSKMHEFRMYKIVTPNWIIDSVTAGRLLPWRDYRLYNPVASQTHLNFQETSRKSPTKASHSPTSLVKPLEHEDVSEAHQRTSQTEQSVSSGSSAGAYGRTFTSREPNEVLTSAEEDQAMDTAEPTSPADNQPSIDKRTRSPRRNVDDISSKYLFRVHELDASGSPPTSPRKRRIISMSHEPNASIVGAELNKELLANEWNRKNSSLAPDFMEKFYKQSRLHYLSTWKAELKAYTSRLQQEQVNRIQRRPAATRRLIMHIDLDCFFASVGIRDRPYLAEMPVAVSHSKGTDTENSSSDVASSNYIARKFGIRNGMNIGKARQLCPNLFVIPYEFEKYKKVSHKFYSIIFQYADKLQAVSVDEALLDISTQIAKADCGEEEEFATRIRAEIKEITGCNASVGIGPNILVARIATRMAKPNGHFYCKPSEVLDFMADEDIEHLPGVGWALAEKLEAKGIEKLVQLRQLSKLSLQEEFGAKTGEMLYNFARGIDNRPLEVDKPRQSWGVRFENEEQVRKFVTDLSGEVSKRLVSVESKARALTLKIRKVEATEAWKHMGHGPCDSYSKSVTLSRLTNETSLIAEHAWALMKQFNPNPNDIRGIGIQMQKLQPVKEPVANYNARHDVSSQRKLDFFAKSAKVTLEPDDLETSVSKRNDLQQEGRAHGTSGPTKASTNNSETASSVTPATETVASVPNRRQSITTTQTFSQIDLPPWSQVDPSVLLDMPEKTRKKILQAYGTRQIGPQTDHRDNDVRTEAPKQRQHPNPTLRPSMVSLPSASQLDPQVLEELPASVRQEIEAAYTKSTTGKLNSTETSAARTSSSVGARVGKGHVTKEATISLTQAPKWNLIRFKRQDDAEESGTGTDDIDPEVLAALPEDVRNEVLAEHHRTKLAEQRQMEHKANYEALKRIERKVNRSSAESVRVSSTPPSLMGHVYIDDIRGDLRSWVNEFPEGPEPEDVSTVQNYLFKLVTYKDLEKASLILLYWRALADKTGSGDWIAQIYGTGWRLVQ
ncbi:hypothetical protein BZG36_01448 [Bifiguratus adelaidae]|uniref:DNA repair protein REV1 n=1 Tax=Bifiguratus adelaidae TaxID=1938954 RepID=A0A261Y510_9FUNG|nr:hypothetical protein BZG36_01448 [Bifiguratus adelaidae]